MRYFRVPSEGMDTKATASTLIRQCELLAPSHFFSVDYSARASYKYLELRFQRDLHDIHRQSLKRSCKGCIVFFFFHNCFPITTRVPNRDVNKLEVAVGHLLLRNQVVFSAMTSGHISIALRAHRSLYRPVYIDGIESKVFLFFFFRRCPIGISIAALSH